MNELKHFSLFILILLYSPFHAFCATTINGDIGNLIFEKAKSPYIVSEDIFIPEGKTTTIKEGTVFLFKSFTGLTIYGNVTVEGAQDNPVIFTSVNDAGFNDSASQLAQSFDWNGILIDRNAQKIQLRNFRLCYSVYGIKSKKDNILIINGVFKDNGQFNFTVNEQIQLVEDKVSYSYGQDALKKSDSLKIEQIKTKYRRPEIITLSSGGVFAATALVLGIVARQAYNSYYDNSSGWNQQEKQAKRNAYQAETITTISTGLASVLLLSTGITLHFVKLKKLKTAGTISFNYDNTHYGISITSSF